MSVTFINAFYEPFAYAYKKPRYACVPPPLVDCVAIVQLAGIPIRAMWQLGRDTSHVPAGFERPRGRGFVD